MKTWIVGCNTVQMSVVAAARQCCEMDWKSTEEEVVIVVGASSLPRVANIMARAYGSHVSHIQFPPFGSQRTAVLS